jgi:hypothetical protein
MAKVKAALAFAASKQHCFATLPSNFDDRPRMHASMDRQRTILHAT